MLDPRGVYVVHAEKEVYVWVGDEIQGNNEKSYAFIDLRSRCHND